MSFDSGDGCCCSLDVCRCFRACSSLFGVQWTAEDLCDNLDKDDKGDGRECDDCEDWVLDHCEDEAEQEGGGILDSESESL